MSMAPQVQPEARPAPMEVLQRIRCGRRRLTQVRLIQKHLVPNGAYQAGAEGNHFTSHPLHGIDGLSVCRCARSGQVWCVETEHWCKNSARGSKIQSRFVQANNFPSVAYRTETVSVAQVVGWATEFLNGCRCPNLGASHMSARWTPVSRQS
jgi:hypothetical protein